MAPLSCSAVQLLLFFLPFVQVTLTAPSEEYALNFLPSAIEKSQTSEKSSPVNTSPSDADLATETATRAHVAARPPPRFPLTYDGLLRRRRNAGPFRKGALDTQYPYDEAPQHPRAPSARRALYAHGDFPLDPFVHAADPARHRAGKADKKYHDCTRKCGVRKMLRSGSPKKEHNRMREGHDCDRGLFEHTENLPCNSQTIVVFVDVSCNHRALKNKKKRNLRGSFVNWRKHRGNDMPFLFENSPDTQSSFDLRNLHRDVASYKAYQHLQNAYNMPYESHVHNVRRYPVFNKVNIPFHGRGLGEYSFGLDGRRDQFSDVVSNVADNPDNKDDGTDVFHKSYKMHNHPKGRKSLNYKSFGFRDVLYGPGSPYSRLSHSGRSSLERMSRRSIYPKGDKSDAYDDHGLREFDAFAHLVHYIPHIHRPCMQHTFRSVARSASSSEHVTGSTSFSPSLTSPSAESPSAASPSSTSPSSASPSSVSPSSASPSSASPSSASLSSASSTSEKSPLPDMV